MYSLFEFLVTEILNDFISGGYQLLTLKCCHLMLQESGMNNLLIILN